MGARPEDYARSAPLNSYIHVDDFNGPRELANFLHELDKNDDLYNQFFKWKVTAILRQVRVEDMKFGVFLN